MDHIDSIAALRDHYGAISPLAERKVLPRLDPHCQSFIRLSPFLVLASADGAGGVDASPRGDAPGFVAIVDETTLLLPDRPGNNRVDSYSNIIANPGVGLLFFVPGVDETLRVNGTARIISDADLLDGLSVNGKVPKVGLVVTVKEAFFHCGKALKRSRLWDQERQIERSTFPSLGRVIADQTGQCTAEEADAAIENAYRVKLYLGSGVRLLNTGCHADAIPQTVVLVRPAPPARGVMRFTSAVASLRPAPAPSTLSPSQPQTSHLPASQLPASNSATQSTISAASTLAGATSA